MNVGEHEDTDQDFLDGFNNTEVEATTKTPDADAEVKEPAEDNPTAQEPELAAVEDGKQIDAPAPIAKTKAPKVEYAKITKADYEALLSKASAIDEIRAEQKQKFDSAFGKIGGIQQVIASLQAGTKRGQKVQITPQHFKELIDEGYEDLATMTANGFNRIMSELDVAGTGGEPKSINQDEFNEIFQQRFNPEREALKSELRQEIAAETLSALHEDWEATVKTQDFQQWMADTKTDQLKDRNGVSFAESLDARFVAKQLDKYKAFAAEKKAAQQKQAARQNRIASAVQPKGSGGHQSSEAEEDDFYAGFKKANTI